MLHFFIDGRSQTAGSKRAVPIIKGGKRVATRVVEDGSPDVREAKRTWRQDLRTTAWEAMRDQGWEREHGPVVLELVFHRQRPAGHYGSGRNARVLKPSAPLWPTGKPDLTKMTRAAEDALTGLVWGDDAQVVSGAQSKVWTCRYTGREGVAVMVRRATLEDLPEPVAGLAPVVPLSLPV